MAYTYHLWRHTVIVDWTLKSSPYSGEQNIHFIISKSFTTNRRCHSVLYVKNVYLRGYILLKLFPLKKAVFCTFTKKNL